MQFDATTYSTNCCSEKEKTASFNIKRKKWVDLGTHGRENGIARIFKHHCAFWQKSCRIRQNQTGSRKLSHPNRRQTYSKYFSDSKNVPVCSFCKEPTTVVDLREARSMVVDSDPASICCSQVMPSESNI